MTPRDHPGHAWYTWAHSRVVLAALVGLVVAAVVWRLAPEASANVLAFLLGYAAAAAIYLGVVWADLVTGSAEVMRHRAARDDPGRLPVFAIALGSGLLVLGSALAILKRGGQLGELSTDTLLWLTLSVAALAWAVTHSSFALHYVHLNANSGARAKSVTDAGVRADENRGGFFFPGGEDPDGLDFAYLAFTVGMTFQVSDVQVTDRDCRRAVLLHGLLSFAYNTVIIALALNLVFASAQTG